MPEKLKIMVVSDVTDFALTDVYYGYLNALKSLSIPHEPFPFHRFKKLFSEEISFQVMHSNALIKDKEFTHIMFIGAQILPTFMLRSMYHLKTIIVATEDPHAFDPQKFRIEEVDYYFSNERTIGNSPKYKNVYYCPTAGCTEECGKIPREHLPEQYHSDILFLGGVYSTRRKTLEALVPLVKKYNLNFKVCGHFGKKFPKKSPLWEYVYDSRTIPHEETVKYYNGAKIVLNPLRDVKWYSKTDRMGNPLNRSRFKGESLNPRAYEVPLCQAFMLMDDTRAESHEVFNKNEVGFYTDNEDLIKKVRYYLIGAGKNKRDEMALRAYRKVAENHTYVHRMMHIKQIIEDTTK